MIGSFLPWRNRWLGLAVGLLVLLPVAMYRYATRPKFDSNHVFKIGYGDDRPLHFRDANGNPSGLAVGLVREAARRRGIHLEWGRSRTPGLTAVKSGEMDLWVMLADLPERHKLVYLNEPYLVTEYCFLVPADSPYRKARDLANARISFAGFNAERLTAPVLFPHAEWIAAGSPGAAFNVMVQGRSSAAFLDEYAAGDLAFSGDRGYKMRMIPIAGPKYYLSLAANFKNRDVADAIRDEIRAMAAEGALSTLFEGWGFFPGLSMEAMDSLSRAKHREQFLTGGVALLVLLLASSLALVLRLKRQHVQLESLLEERQRAGEENAKLQVRLHQANKMESVGRLAGGVAHDFNNLLTVINGYSEVLLNQSGLRDPVRNMIEAIHAAGERAAGLTSQLLAFSRKQTVQPKAMDLNTVVKDIERVSERLIGEDIEVLTALDPELGQLVADPDQIHQVLMNLVVNARDAMPDGGTLKIETANVNVDGITGESGRDAVPGHYVMLTVTDSGIGMDRETRENAFEPFFTTKETGKGTGLGLATVYGIVTQNGGWIDVRSEVGKGTAFNVYLPRTELGLSPEPAMEAIEPSHGGQTVLLVEDEDSVRGFARGVLESYGYIVLEASDGNQARDLAEKHAGEIHLLLTDVILRGMNGKKLSESLAALRSSMKVLFMSGYPSDVIAGRGVLEPGIPYVQKPFTPGEIASKVWEVLNGPVAAA